MVSCQLLQEFFPVINKILSGGANFVLIGVPLFFSKLFIVLPHLGTMPSSLKQKLLQKFITTINIKIILKSTNGLSSLFRFKDVIPK